MHSMMLKCTWPVLENSQSPTFTFLLFPSPPCSPEASAEPVPPSPGRWSQDLLGGIVGYVNRALFVSFFFSRFFHAQNYLFISGESTPPYFSCEIEASPWPRLAGASNSSFVFVCSESSQVKVGGALDVLADDVIPINTEAHR